MLHRHGKTGSILALLVGAVALAGLVYPLLGSAQKKPKGFRQIVSRGGIAAIDNPRFVPASEAKVDPDSWFFGVVIDGQPRAFSINILNYHEVVNDSIGGTHYAAVW